MLQLGIALAIAKTTIHFEEGDRIMKSKKLRGGVTLGLLAFTMGVTGMGCTTHYVGGGSGGGYSGGGSGGGGGTDPYYPAWYDVYGSVCSYDGPSAGCNYYSDGTQIVDVEDPYFGSSYLLEYFDWQYYDTYGYPTSYMGYAWLSPTGILYDEWGYALNEENEGHSKDILAEAAVKEEETIKKAGEKLTERFAGLTSDQGVSIARSLSNWATLSRDKKRHRTTEDMAQFGKQIFGVDIKEAEKALLNALQGQMDDVEFLNDQVAAHWNTTPETSKAIMMNWYKKQIEGADVKL